MTNQEAISIIDTVAAGMEHRYMYSDEEISEAFDMAVEALEKQIPMKPKSVFCSQCGEEFTDDDYWSADYCRNCGQAICWEE